MPRLAALETPMVWCLIGLLIGTLYRTRSVIFVYGRRRADQSRLMDTKQIRPRYLRYLNAACVCVAFPCPFRPCSCGRTDNARRPHTIVADKVSVRGL